MFLSEEKSKLGIIAGSPYLFIEEYILFRSILTGFGLTLSFAAAATPVTFQNIPEIARRFERPDIFCKITPTLGRLPSKEMLGAEFPTYVSNGKGGATLETTNIITDSVVIARMPTPITGDIYNEWLIPKEFWKDTYGELPSDANIKAYYRVHPISAIKITDSVLKLLDSRDGKTASIMIPWNPDGMVAYKNGYLAELEYAIAPAEMKANYKKMPPSTTHCSPKQ